VGIGIEMVRIVNKITHRAEWWPTFNGADILDNGGMIKVYSMVDTALGCCICLAGGIVNE